MKTKALIFSLLVAVSAQAQAKFVDGTELARRAAVFERYNQQSSVTDGIDVANYMGYTMGVADAVSGSLICPPGSTSAQQIGAIVAKYLRNNPEKWHQGRSTLVVDALRPVFPCK